MKIPKHIADNATKVLIMIETALTENMTGKEANPFYRAFGQVIALINKHK